ncbi:hypothetical protein CFC21_098438 [Triticum aestivum]|uniref:Transcription factor CBF/NF-Y/archaeal histone domain-containing protein n=2 Tax=Triticum aestivum TaxID=4565 RepID=A0A9R1N0V7_WHEAT|nr:uncharacterized protein LOC123151378 [Triticum aestivum]KAF7096509.1 hypothetical protein CFC21_098438 [Triticum aestivum]
MGTEQAKEGRGAGEERVVVRTGPRPALPAPQQRAVDQFWRERQEDMEATVDFNDRILPMSRLKRLIRAEEDGMLIAADTPAYLAKLCELFVQELALRAWACAQSHHRRIILESDIAEAIAFTESYDFLATVLLEHQREARLVGRAATPTTPVVTAARARLITRKRHMPDPNPRRPVHGVRRIRPRALPVTPTSPPPDVRYVPVPFPFPSAPIGATATAEGLMIIPPINAATTGRAFFLDMNSGTSFAGENSAAETMASPPPAGPAGAVALPSVHPAAYYLCAYPVTNDVEAFAVGNTDPDVIPPEIVVGDVAIPPEIIEGNVADGNGDGGQQQQQTENLGGNGENVVVPQSNDVQEDGADGMFLEEILMDEDLMFPDAELFSLVGAAPDPEDFIVDQDVLDDVFANPSSSASSD